MRAAVVTAYVPLNVKHLDAAKYHEYGERLKAACDGRLIWFDNWPLTDCWLYKEVTDPEQYSPATPTPEDRYEKPSDHTKSNIVQHSRTQWALLAKDVEPDVDVVVWLDLAILKQGAFTGKQITEDHVREFLKKVESYPYNDIPFPGIEEKKEVLPHGNNWRFCGSTHIWPVKWLNEIDHQYRFYTKEFIRRHSAMPLDLAIWPAVEEKSGLPFKWYKAEYDYTQLTEFPHG
ncbi:MAG TPA: hypothetical protein VFK47_20850 [Ktedonobacteraceae bacterium]|nr:hypothetical protein [Ktedonobacteraceae bacterium]